MTHYDTLGVPPDAAPEDIKSAFRKKARKHHPDKGGKTDDMAEVNKAYAVLSDDTMRRKYDQTGDDREMPSVDTQATNLLMQLFAHSIENDVSNPVIHATMSIKSTIQKIEQQIASVNAKIKKFEKRRNAVKVKKGNNIFTNLVDAQITQHNGSIGLMENNRDVGRRALELLNNYTSDEPDPTMPSPFSTWTTHHSTSI